MKATNKHPVAYKQCTLKVSLVRVLQKSLNCYLFLVFLLSTYVSSEVKMPSICCFFHFKVAINFKWG